MTERDMQKAALRGEPSYVWRAGQQRRLEMIVQAAGERIQGRVLENGCGVGMYVEHMLPFGGQSSDWNMTSSAPPKPGFVLLTFSTPQENPSRFLPGPLT